MREISIARELTKKYEEHIGSTINEVIEYFENNEVLGEFTIVIKGLKKDNNIEIDTIYLKEELNELINAGLSLSAAARYLAKKKNITKSIIYNLH